MSKEVGAVRTRAYCLKAMQNTARTARIVGNAAAHEVIPRFVPSPIITRGKGTTDRYPKYRPRIDEQDKERSRAALMRTLHQRGSDKRQTPDPGEE